MSKAIFPKNKQNIRQNFALWNVGKYPEKGAFYGVTSEPLQI